MISNAKDRVSLSALLRSKPLPSSWATTCAFGLDYWWNQENGWTYEYPPPLPDWSDVGKVTGWRLR